MNRRSLVRPLLASAAIAAALALGGCDTDGLSSGGRAFAPLSQKMLAEIEQKNMAKESPILVRLFKQEAELEVWKQDQTGRFALLKTYPICRWSGELGPKIKEGDRQAPEGFYSITPNLLNPNSSYYLAINMGFPNAYDKANGRTGAFLMIHGDCSSRGCYAMTDEQISEIYALARESLFGGQQAFQIQAYPFRMTPANMAKHRNSPHMAFWKMLKQGSDHFEVTRLEPKVDVCERRYVFDAEPPAGSSTPLRFNATAKCPVFQIPDDVVAAVKEKQDQDNTQMAELIRKGTPAAPVRTGVDGGMNPVFLAAVKPQADPFLPDGRLRAFTPLPGTVPAHTVPPGESAPTGTVILGNQTTRVAAAAPTTQSSNSGNLFGNLFSSNGDAGQRKEQPSAGMMDGVSRLIGLRGSEPEPQAANVPAPKPKPAAVAARPVVPAAAPGAIRPKPDTDKATANAGAIRPQQPVQNQEASASSPQGGTNMLNGAAPAVPTGTFDSRWGGFR